MKLYLAILALLLGAALPAQNLFKKRSGGISLFADHRAQTVGDILTVVIREATRIKNEDKVNRNTTTSLDASLDAFTFTNKLFNSGNLPEIQAGSSRSHEGSSKLEKDDQVDARVAVIVIDVLPNGNLVVAGSRIVSVDDEERTLRISGLVRPLDVTRDNTVPSAQVADARVSITGQGAAVRSTTKGPVGTFVDTLFWAAWPF